jgi:hypothetical protein
MAILIEEEKKNLFRTMSKSLNMYVKSKDCQYFSEIEKSLKEFFDANEIALWYCDKDTKALSRFCSENSEILAMDSSLTEKVIQSKKPLIENHITSNKYFNSKIDNPLGLKVKSLLIFPIIEHKKVIAILKVWRGLKHRKNFSKKDEDCLDFFHSIFLGFIVSRGLEKAKLPSRLGEKIQRTSRRKPQSPIVSPSISRKKEPSKEESALASWKEKFRALEKEKLALEKDKIEVLKEHKISIKSMERSLIEEKKVANKNASMAQISKEDLAKVAQLEEEIKLFSKRYSQLEQAKMKQDKSLSLEIERYKSRLSREEDKKNEIKEKCEKRISILEEEITDYSLESLKEKKNIQALEDALEVYKENLNNTDNSNKSLIKAHDNALAILKEECKADKDKIIENKKILAKEREDTAITIETLRRTIEEAKSKTASCSEALEDMKKELYYTVESYAKIEDELSLSKKENNALDERIQEFKVPVVTTSIQDLKSQQRQASTEYANIFEENIEYLLEHFSSKFSNNEVAYTIFEMIVYALSSGKGMGDIEEILKRSKILIDLIDGYYFRGDLVVCNKRHTLVDMLTHIESYEKNIFGNKIYLDIHLDKSMPSSLVFDRIKVQSIILHLLSDLEKFIDEHSNIDIRMSLEDKHLKIELGGKMYQKDGLFNSMFKQTKLAMDNKERTGLQLSRKVIERLKGNIKFSYANEYYKLIVVLPVQVIRM